MSFATAYSTKKRGQKCMAKGGEAKFHHPDIRYKNERGVNAQDTDEGKRGESHAGVAVRSGSMRDAKEAHRDTIKEMRSMPKPNLMAEGGEVEDAMHGEQSDEDMLDMVGRIIAKHMFSKGGEVANDVEPIADEMPAEFDDMVLDDHLEDDSSAGNEEGDAEQEERDADVVTKVLSSRKKKDKLPRPA